MRHLNDERVKEQGSEKVNLDLMISTSSSFDKLGAKVCKSTYATKTTSDGLCVSVSVCVCSSSPYVCSYSTSQSASCPASALVSGQVLDLCRITLTSLDPYT